MIQTLSHTFKFNTPSAITKNKILQNILFISEEDEKKHFIQYLQYSSTEDSSTIQLSHVNVKVDRGYYLEIANIAINDRERRRYLFAILGKRRFGANSRRYDYYFLDSGHNTEELENDYLDFTEGTPFKACYSEKTDYSLNEYRVHSIPQENSYIIFMDQINTTQRKKLHKIFCVELKNEDYKIFSKIEKGKKRVNYLFNKIGKIYFKSLEKENLTLNKKFSNFEDLALSKIITTSSAMEKNSRVNDNLTFRKLKDKEDVICNGNLCLHTSCFNLMNNPSDVETIILFQTALSEFISHTKEIKQLDEIISYFESINLLVKAGTISYLLTKYDNDIKDIFLYMLESFTTWNNALYHTKEEDVKTFNVATVDLTDSLRYLVDVCYKFKHEYTCIEAELDNSDKSQTESINQAIQQSSITSAQKYFQEVELDSEVYDELHELERDVDMLSYADTYTYEINNNLINFFEGYTSALNPLFEFKDLSYSLMLLGQKLTEYEIEENSEILLALMRGLISDLVEWKRTVLVEKNAEDIHYMDKSFYSNIAQIEMSIEHSEFIEGEDEDAIEFF